MTKKTDEVIAEVVDETPKVSNAAPAGVPSLSIQDLENLRNIIDVASKRGVFKTEEFTIVGDAYAKLAAFITAIKPAPAAQAEAPAAPAEAAPTPPPGRTIKEGEQPPIAPAAPVMNTPIAPAANAE